MPIISGSGGGAPAFNGGTITTALDIESATAPALTAHVTAGSNVEAARITGNGVRLHVLADSGSEAMLNADRSVAMLQLYNTGSTSDNYISAGDNVHNDAFSVDSGGAVVIRPTTGNRGLAVADDSGTLRAIVQRDGAYTVALNAAPADANIAAGQCCIWFDQTNGEAGLELKSKTANGTVRTSAYPVRQTSGALSTINLVSGVASQISTHYDAQTVTQVEFDPGVATDAECLVELSPNNVTYTTLGTEIVPPGAAFDGTVRLINVLVPAGWYIRLTCNAQAGILSTTYY